MVIVEKGNQICCELNIQILSLSDLQDFFHHNVENILQQIYMEIFSWWSTYPLIQLLLKCNDRLVHRAQFSLPLEHAGVPEFQTKRGTFHLGRWGRKETKTQDACDEAMFNSGKCTKESWWASPAPTMHKDLLHSVSRSNHRIFWTSQNAISPYWEWNRASLPHIFAEIIVVASWPEQGALADKDGFVQINK